MSLLLTLTRQVRNVSARLVLPASLRAGRIDPAYPADLCPALRLRLHATAQLIFPFELWYPLLVPVWQSIHSA